ncbi:MAG TPA: FtsX-like permease family protein [Symbiobacteriaceae bacterium]|nr:FtsX-like permease family protein [Symbiobacteriaceae bacterium]
MRHYTGLIIRYLRKQARQSVLTVLGVALSVGLITGIGITAGSMTATQVNQARELYGNYHLKVTTADADVAAALRSHVQVADAGLQVPLGSYDLPGKHLFISLEGWDEALREIMGVTLLQGSFPATPDEIALEEWLLEQFPAVPQLGQMLTMAYQRTEQTADGSLRQYTGEASFRLTGILANTAGGKAVGAGLGLIMPEAASSQVLPDSLLKTYFIRLRHEENARAAIGELQRSLGLPAIAVRPNEGLLEALGESGRPNWPLLFMGLVILTATVAAIYNIFHIAVLERIQQFGMLRSLGATPRQIRHIVLGEALGLGALATPAGLMLGVLLAVAVVSVLSQLMHTAVSVTVSPAVLAGSALLGLASTLASAYQPARLAARVSPLDAIRGPGRGMQAAARRKPWLWQTAMRRLFGIAGVMAYENLWRNRIRSLITIFSMTLAVSLLILVSYFAAGSNPVSVVEEYIRSDYLLESADLIGSTGFSPADTETVARAPGVAAVSPTRFLLMLWSLSPTQAGAVRSSINPRSMQPEGATGRFTMPMPVNGYTADALDMARKALVAGTIDPERMAREPVALVVGEKSGLNVGDRVLLRLRGLNGQAMDFTIGGILRADTALLMQSPVVTESRSLFVLHEAQFQKAVRHDLVQRLEVKLSPGADRQQVERVLEQVRSRVPQGTLRSYQEELARLKAEKRQIMTLAYGLIAGIAIIGLFNIINTISTNLILRTREFGTLRAIGMTLEQLRQMVRLEGLLYGLFGAMWGAGIGSALAYVLFLLQRSEMTYLQWAAPWAVIGLVCAGTLTVTVMATYVPMRRVASLQIIESIRAIE